MSKHPYPEHIVEAIKEQLAKGYGDLYVCTRDDSAWSYGTMSLDDFHRLDSDEDVIDDLANDMLEMLWEASRVDTLDQLDELDHKIVVIDRTGHVADDYVSRQDIDHTDLPAHVIHWGDQSE